MPGEESREVQRGSGLLRDLPRSDASSKRCAAAVTIPFTVKFRAGWSDDEIVCVELGRMAESCGLAAVALHAAHPRAGLQRTGALGVDCCGKRCGEDSGDRQRRHSHAGRRLRHGHANWLRRGDDRPHGSSNPWIFRQIQQYCSAPGAAGALVRPAGGNTLEFESRDGDLPGRGRPGFHAC